MILFCSRRTVMSMRIVTKLNEQCLQKYCPNILYSTTSISQRAEASCPHIKEINNAKPYSEIPGPKPLPILGE